MRNDGMRRFAIAAYKGDMESVRRIVEEENFPINSQYRSSSQRRGAPVISNMLYYGKQSAGYLLIAGAFSFGSCAALAGIFAAEVSLLAGAATSSISLATSIGINSISSWTDAAFDFNWNCYDKQNWTALHFAAVSGNIEVACYLLKKGANPELQDYHERDFLKIAEISGHTDFVRSCLTFIQARLEHAAKMDAAARETSRYRRQYTACMTELLNAFTRNEDLRNENEDLKSKNEDLRSENEDLKSKNEAFRGKNKDVRSRYPFFQESAAYVVNRDSREAAARTHVMDQEMMDVNVAFIRSTMEMQSDTANTPAPGSNLDAN